MAWNQGPKFIAGGTIAPARFVMVSTAADNTALQATANAKLIGVSQEGMKRTPGLAGSDDTIAAEANDEIDVFGEGDVAMLTTGAAVVRGDWLQADAAGKAIAAAGVGAHFVGAVALESAGAADVKIQVQVLILAQTI